MENELIILPLITKIAAFYATVGVEGLIYRDVDDHTCIEYKSKYVYGKSRSLQRVFFSRFHLWNAKWNAFRSLGGETSRLATTKVVRLLTFPRPFNTRGVL